VAAELGIDLPAILQRTKSILFYQMKSSCLDELDFGGALIFLLLLGGLHLLVSMAKLVDAAWLNIITWHV